MRDLPHAQAGRLRRFLRSLTGEFFRIVVFRQLLCRCPRWNVEEVGWRECVHGLLKVRTWNGIHATASVTDKGRFGMPACNLLLLDIVAACFGRLAKVSAR